MKKIYEYTLIGSIGLLPIIMLATYMTHTEKVIMPILMVMIIISIIKLRKVLGGVKHE